MKNKEKNGTFLVFTICFVILLVPEIVNGYCGTCGNTPQSTIDECGFTVTHNCTYNSPLCRYEDCGPWPVSGGIYRPSEGKTCYYNFESDACAGGTGGGGGGCTYSSCTDCTLPSCPSVNGDNSDYTTSLPVDADGNEIDPPLDACIGNSISCSGTDNCDKDCNPQSDACYLPETNLTAIPTPTWNRLKIGVITSENLSTNSASPTLVHFPLPGVQIRSITNTITNPTGSRELRYNFLIDATAPAIAQTSNELLDKPLHTNLTQGYTGSIRTNYQTLNKCNDSVRSGSTLTTYYKVNTLPSRDSISVSIYGEPGDNKTARNCTGASSFSGQEVNNPLTIKIEGTDINGTSTINGAFLWMVKEGSSIPAGYFDKRYPVGPGQTRTDPNVIGFFLAHSPSGNSASIYKSDNSTGVINGWGRDTHDGTKTGTPSLKVNDPSGKIMIEYLEVLSHEIIDGKFTFVLRLTFPEPSSLTAPIAGKYNFYAGMTDTLSYYDLQPGMYVELRAGQLKNQPSWLWNFDFINPTIPSYSKNVPASNQREIDLSWVNDGTGSSIKDTVVNVYIDPDPDPSNTKTELQVKRLAPVGSLLYPIEKPGSDNIGLFFPSATSGWHTLGSLEMSNIDIGFNTSGVMSFFTTIYDQACNSFTTGSNSTWEYNLDKWIATKGGIFYSDGLVGFVPKNISPYNLGTELISTTQPSYPQVNSFSDLMNPVIVRSVKDSNDTNSDTIFSYLSERYQKMSGAGFIPIANIGQCTSVQKCILSASSVGADGGVTTTYSGKILVVSSGNIDIYPDIVATNPSTDGLIFFSGGNINIVGTHRKSDASSLLTDRIEAMMIARNGITITKEDPNPSTQQDRIEIIGSLLGLGSDNTGTSVFVERNLGLQNINYPVLNVMYHPKYAKLSELFFGTDTTTYKQEVGFKF